MKSHCSEESYSMLKYFLGQEFRLDEESFKQVVYRRHNLGKKKLSNDNIEKINKVINQGYQRYLDMCQLIDKKKVNFYIGKNNGEHVGEYVKNGLNCIVDEKSNRIEFDCAEYPIPRFNIDLQTYYMKDITIHNNTQLMHRISGSSVIVHMMGSYDINEYSLLYGNNPIILAVSKGWNHTDPDGAKQNRGKFLQRKIINDLLDHPNLDPNVIELKTGMTPLHIACLRGDDPELITRLLKKGAGIEAKDYKGNKPIDLLNYEYKEVQKIIGSMTGRIFGVDSGNIRYEENKSFCATLPTKQERDENIKQIREILLSNVSIKKQVNNERDNLQDKPDMTSTMLKNTSTTPSSGSIGRE